MPHRWRSRARTHPAEVLVKQAVSMGWQKESEISKDGNPRPRVKRSVRLVRDDDEAVVWYHDATVTLVRRVPESLDDFVELERWLATHEADDDDDEEVSRESSTTGNCDSSCGRDISRTCWERKAPMSLLQGSNELS
jgi:hypothetical protein